ncbi:MAG: hypothetical protein KA297_01960 [Kofleriaceae bacterium]|nr:hypothetical protein [Kofleriaceae bacterium]MBP6835959.1 hypothetical protein [Kofleriaceae bacterium]
MSDLVIGGRRSRRQYALRALLLALALAIAAVVVAWFIYRRSVAYEVASIPVRVGPLRLDREAPGAAPRLATGQAELTWVGEIPVIRAGGDLSGIYLGVGRLLGDRIDAPTAAASAAMVDAIPRDGVWGRLAHGTRTAWRYRFLDDGLSERDRRALAGLWQGARASGARSGHDTLLRAQAMLDVGAVAGRAGEPRARLLTRALTVRVAQADAPPGRAWIGRSFALPGLIDGGDSATPVLLIAHPTDALAWAGVTWPGSIGVVSGVNAEGIVVTLHPARTRDVRETRIARPTALVVRDVLERARTLDDAIRLLSDTTLLGSAAFMVVDGQAGTWAVVERSPTRTAVSRGPSPAVVGDLLSGSELADDPQNDRARRTSAATDRLARAAQLVRAPLAGPAALAAALRDRRSADGVARAAGHRGLVDDAAAQHVAIFDPVTLVMWIGRDTDQALRGIDLRHELRGEGDRPAPPADLAPTTGGDGASTEPVLARVRTARADLRAARAALGAGRLAAAHELAMRALTRAPDLPEALEWMARIELARGDRDAARTFAERWLDAGIDAPGSAEELRGALGLSR